MNVQPVINAFKSVSGELAPFVNLQSEDEYNNALALMDELFD